MSQAHSSSFSGGAANRLATHRIFIYASRRGLRCSTDLQREGHALWVSHALHEQSPLTSRDKDVYTTYPPDTPGGTIRLLHPVGQHAVRALY